MASLAAITKAKEALLQALSNLHADNETKPLLQEVAEDAGYKGPSGKAIRTAIKQLKELGTIKTGDGKVELTPEGIKKMPKPGPRAPRKTNTEFQAELIQKMLKDPKGLPKEEQIQKMFTFLSDGTFQKREQMAKIGGYSRSDSKPFKKLIQRMYDMKLIEKKHGILRLTGLCFPRGRPTALQVYDKASENSEVPRKDQSETNIEGNDASTKSAKKKRKFDDSEGSNEESAPKKGSTNAEFQAKLIQKILKYPKGIPKKEQITKMFNFLSDGAFHKREDMAKIGGYSRSDSAPFKKLIQRMNDMKLLEKKHGILRLHDKCFPRGRPTAPKVEAEVASKDQGDKGINGNNTSAESANQKRKFNNSKDAKHNNTELAAKEEAPKKKARTADGCNPNTPLPWSKRHKKVTKASSGGLQFSLSNSFAQPLIMKELLEWTLESGDQALVDKYNNHSLEYTPNGGSLDLKQAIANLYGPNISAQNILVFPGGQVALQTAAQAVCHPDMHAIAFGPGYQSVVTGAKLAGAGSITEIALDPSKDWQIDVAQVQQALQENTTYLVLNEPYNPAGTLMSHSTQTELVSVARNHNLHVLCDEVYRLLEHDNAKQLPAMADAYEKGLSVVAMSKPWGGCGITVGWIATQDLELLEHISDLQYFGTACVSRASELQALMVLKASHRILQRNLEIIRHNKSLLKQFMTDYEEFFHWIEPTAGAICAIHFKGNQTSNQLGEELAKAGIGIKPAYCFTDKEAIPKEKDYFRVGFGEAKVPKALEALRQFVEQRKEEWRKEMESSSTERADEQVTQQQKEEESEDMASSSSEQVTLLLNLSKGGGKAGAMLPTTATMD